MLFTNLFATGGALLESVPQGDASVPVRIHEDDAAVVRKLLMSAEVSSALAALYLAGVQAGERAAHGFIAGAVAGGRLAAAGPPPPPGEPPAR